MCHVNISSNSLVSRSSIPLNSYLVHLINYNQWQKTPGGIRSFHPAMKQGCTLHPKNPHAITLHQPRLTQANKHWVTVETNNRPIRSAVFFIVVTCPQQVYTGTCYYRIKTFPLPQAMTIETVDAPGAWCVICCRSSGLVQVGAVGEPKQSLHVSRGYV